MTAVVDGRDAARAGQVLMWQPQGAGDFADLAWVLAEVLGNGAAVTGLDVSRAASGALFGRVRCDNPGYVRDAASRLGWHLYEPDDTYANAWGQVGDMVVDLVWLAAKPDDISGSPVDQGSEGVGELARLDTEAES